MGRNLPLIIIPLLIATSIFVPRTLAFLPAAFALGAYIWHALKNKELLFANKYACLFLALISALSFASYFWAAYPENALDRSYSAVGILFSGFIMLAVARKLPSIPDWPLKKLALSSTITLCLTGLFFLVEHKMNFPVGRLSAGDEFLTSFWNRGMVVMSMAFIPCLYLLHKTYGFSQSFVFLVLLLITCLGLPLLETQSQTAQIMFIVALTGYFASFYFKKFLLVMTAIIVVALTFTTPLIPKLLKDGLTGVESPFMTSASMPHRLEVWNFVAEKIQEKPWIGHGVECVRSMKSAEIMPHIQSDTILHPHNAFLQVWVEMGFLGAFLTGALLLFVLRRIDRSSPDHEPFYYAVFISSLSLLSTGYGLWQSWQMGLLLGISALAIICARILPPAKS